MFGKLGGSSKPAAPAATSGSGSAMNLQQVTRTLQVDVIEARGLLACQKNGTSDPYAVVLLADLSGREVKNETFNTKQKNGTLSPTWNESFTFGKSYALDSEVADVPLPTLMVKVYHKAAYSVSETPMGVVEISLDNIDPQGNLVDQWYPLTPYGRMKECSGDVHLRLKFNRPTTAMIRGGFVDDEEQQATGNLDKDEVADESPNELHVFVHAGRNLIAMDKPLFGEASSDPQVKLQIDGFDTYRTKYVRKNLNPSFKDEEFVWTKVIDPALSLSVTVEDHNDIKPTPDFMGRVAIPLHEFDTKRRVRRWYKLKNKEMTADGIERGEIEISIHWVFNVKVQEQILKDKKKYEKSAIGQLTRGISTMKGQVAGTLGKLTGHEADEDSDDGLEDADDDKEVEAERAAPQTEEQKAEAKKKEEEKRKELSEIEIKDGDYQVQVHIIEARDLKGENADGTSDPIVFVECFGQKRNTMVIKQTTSCVFDELFIFNMKNLDKDAFEEGFIRIACYDSTIMSMVGGKNKMIGFFAIDAPLVYNMNKDHEMYRQWVPLIDDEDPEDVGVQGYLKISISIIGPGEKVKVHDEDAERAAEIAREAAAGSDVSSMILSVPTIQKEWKYLVVKVYKAEGLPVMDGKVGTGMMTLSKAGTDAFCQLSFAGGKPVKTRVVTVQGESRNQINPQFNYELWYPVSMPTMTQLVKFNVWDKDTGGQELIGNVGEKFAKIKKATGQALPLQWYNMYGAPEFKQEKLAANLTKGVTAIAKKAKQTLGADIDWKVFYNNATEKASAYKGRVLLEFSIKDQRPPKYDKAEVKPFRRRLKPIKSTQEPPTRDYILQAMIICGNDLPAPSALNAIVQAKYRIRVTCGVHELCTRDVKMEGGVCRWNEFLISEKIALPMDIAQIPDIFIYLIREDDKPICFTRLKSWKELKKSEEIAANGGSNYQLYGFTRPAEWVLLREDKTLDALPDDMFPGSILMKLGFGIVSDSEMTRPTWQRCLEDAKKMTEYQVRVLIYQCRNLPAADSNGLCDPYMKVNFAGEKEKKTHTKKKTLFPVYYETMVFKSVGIPAAENFQYAPQICMRLYDHDDFDAHDYLGTCQINLKHAFVTDALTAASPTYKPPLPKWYSFFYEVPGDSQGEVLASVQLIPTNGKDISDKNLPSIKPSTRPAFIEFLAIGIRDMAPYNFQSMQAPFMEVELASFDTKYTSTTQTSKRPDPSNPNFLEHLVIPVELPDESIFTVPLCIQAKDTRLGGYLKPIVGVCQIDLTTKLPWCLDTYKPPQSEVFFKSIVDPSEQAKSVEMALLPNANNDPIAQKTRKMEQERSEEKKGDDYIASSEPVALDSYINERVNMEDSGAGVFGALNHIDFKGKGKRRKTGEDAFADPDWTQDDGDQPPAWSVNRKKLEAELEMDLLTTPFETYALTRGQVNGFLGSKVKTVGRLKGLIRVIEERGAVDNDPMIPKSLMEQLLKPKKYIVRLYALRAFGLEEMDFDIFGNKAKSDPYLKVKLGKNLFDDRDHAVNDVLEVDLYKVVTFETELPGVSQLNVEIMDKDLIGSDDLIGKTTIDLEDRWFDSRWQEWGQENMITPGSDPNDPGRVRWATKPIERRTLYAPGFTLGRGTMELWVDIMTPEQALAFPPDEVSLPPKQIFEVRVVIWKTKDVPPMDSLEGMSDLFVKCWPEGCDPQETDTHWRCKKGKASFNWRMLFDVELGHNTRAMKFPYFHLQLWDRDILKWNDCAGEGVIDLGKYYRKAYKRNVCLKLFEKPKGLQAKRAKAKALNQRDDLIEDLEDDVVPDEEDEPQQEGVQLTNTTSTPAPAANVVLPPRDNVDSDDDDDATASNFDSGMGAIPTTKQKKVEHQMLLKKPSKKYDAKKSAREKKEKAEKLKAAKEAAKAAKAAKALAEGGEEGEEVKKEAKGGIMSRLAFWRKKDDAEVEEEEQALIENEEKKEDEDQEMKDMVTTFKNMTGLWDIDPEDSAWYHLETRDKNDPSKVTPMGSICYSIQIWPKDKATLMPVGNARGEPNTNPFLPPPVGRLKFSWNPFVLGSELCGPVLCAKLFCCLLCMAFILLMIFCQPFLNIIINLIFVVY